MDNLNSKIMFELVNNLKTLEDIVEEINKNNEFNITPNVTVYSNTKENISIEMRIDLGKFTHVYLQPNDMKVEFQYLTPKPLIFDDKFINRLEKVLYCEYMYYKYNFEYDLAKAKNESKKKIENLGGFTDYNYVSKEELYKLMKMRSMWHGADNLIRNEYCVKECENIPKEELANYYIKSRRS